MAWRRVRACVALRITIRTATARRVLRTVSRFRNRFRLDITGVADSLALAELTASQSVSTRCPTGGIVFCLSCVVLLLASVVSIHIDENVAPHAHFVVHYTQWTSSVPHGSVPGVEPERLDITGTAHVVALAPRGRFNEERFSFSEIDATTKSNEVSRLPSHGTFTIERDVTGTPRSPDFGPLGYIPAFPVKAVSIGDSWSAQVPVTALDGKGVAQYRYRLDGVRSEGGHTLAQVSLAVTGTFAPGGKQVGWTGTESGRGSITWDVERHERRSWNFEIRDVGSRGKDSVVVTNGLRADWTATSAITNPRARP